MTTNDRRRDEHVQPAFEHVDLELYDPLPQPEIVKALGDDVVVVYAGEFLQGWRAVLRPAVARATAEDAVMGLIELLRGLPPIVRSQWDRVQSRAVELQLRGPGLEIDGLLTPVTWAALDELGLRFSYNIRCR